MSPAFLSLFLLVLYPNHAISQRETVDPRPPMLFSRNRPLLSRNCTSLKIASDPPQFPRTALISLVNSESPPRIISSPDSEWQFAFCVVIKKKQQLGSDSVPHLQMILINIWWVASLWSANKLWEEKTLKWWPRLHQNWETEDGFQMWGLTLIISLFFCGGDSTN